MGVIGQPTRRRGNDRVQDPFDNIVWDAAIEHFTEQEIDTLLKEIVGLLGDSGIVSGFTLTERDDGRKSNVLHEYEFKDKDDLRRFFTPHFKHMRIWETIYPKRHNLYFAVSQQPVEMFYACVQAMRGFC